MLSLQCLWWKGGQIEMKRINYSDTEAREAIVKDLDSNLFVEASAGSGKTTSLVNRMVALIEKGTPIDKICTITFTIAAADEFFARFQELLSRRMIDNPNDESINDLGPTTPESRKRCEEALQNIDLCFMGTMDSFCNMVAHELPIEIGVPSDARVISDAEKADFVKEKYYEVLTNNNHHLYSLATTFAKAFKNPYSAFCKGIDLVFDYRDYQVAFDTDLLNSSSDHIIDAELNELKSLKNEIIKDGLGCLSESGYDDVSTILSIKKDSVLDDWKWNAQKILYGINKINKGIRFEISVQGTSLETNYLVKPPKAQKYSYSDSVLDLVKKIKETIHEYLFQLFFSFVGQMRDDIVKDMGIAGKFTFFDFLYYLRQKFEESAAGDRELITHVYERHQKILIDESQDTNPMQTELFFFLTSTNNTNDWTKAQPHEGSLFIVGDPKQSIYGFRDADVKAFKKTKEIFGNNDEVVVLSKNYRSNIVLKEWFNNMMNSVLSHGSEPTTHPNIPLIAENNKEKERELLESDKTISLNGVYKYETAKNRKDDAKILANLVKTIVNNDHYKIISKKVPDKNNPARKIQYKDILIITREKKLAEYVDCFSKENIPFMIEATIYFECSKSFGLLTKLLNLLFEPYKIQHLVRILKSDLYKLNTEDIVQMCLDGFTLNIADLTKKDGNPVVFSNHIHQRIIEELHQLYTDVHGMTVSSTLFFLLTNNKYLFINKTDTAFLEYAYYLIELIKAKENDGSISSFSEAQKYINSMLNNDSGVEKAMRFKQDVDQVKFSNLHKVKGLQAPIVILACPSVTIKEASSYKDTNNKKLYFSSVSAKDKYENSVEICSSIKYDSQIKAANEASESEDGRLEYVAATRAESVLIIGHPATINANCNNPWQHLLDDPNITDIPDYPSNPSVNNLRDFDAVMNGYQSIVNNNCNNQSYKVKNPSGLKLRSLSTNVDEVIEEEDNVDKALIGTIVHRLLECIVSSHNSYDLNKLVKQVEGEYALNESQYEDLLLDVANKFTNGGFTQNGANIPTDLFSVLMQAKNVMCEVPFAFESNGDVTSGIIDLLYEDDSGWHIIDYKTNAEDSINNLEQEYRLQLDTYRQAFKDATGKNCDAHIYHVNV